MSDRPVRSRPGRELVRGSTAEAGRRATGPCTTPTSHGAGREGVALVLLLVLLLALTLLGQGILILARRELGASSAFLHATRAEEAAHGAVYLGMERIPSSTGAEPSDTLASLEARWTTDGIWQGVGIRWLGPELFLLEGEGRSRGWPGSRVLAALGWRLDPASRIRAFRGGVELGGQVLAAPAAVMEASDVDVPPEGWEPEDCWGSQEPPGVPPSPAGLPLASTLEPPDTSASAVGSEIPPLGLLTGPELLDRSRGEGSWASDGRFTGTSAGCPDTDPPLLLASGADLVLAGAARVCGILLVGGDLRLSEGAVVRGLTLVGGSLIIEAGSRFEGMARIGGALVVEDSGILRIRSCPVFRALAGTPAILKPIVLPGSSGIHLR